MMEYEGMVRFAAFVFFLAAVGCWEVVAPRRRLVSRKTGRWLSNLGIMTLNTITLRLLFPAAAVGLAVTAEARGWGLLNNWQLPPGPSIIVAVITLDFAIYLQHVMFHAVPAFWRLHMVHHADLDFDVSTGVRFHTFEIILSMLIKFAVVVTLGPPVLAVLIFEILLNATSMFNHGNIRIPLTIDRWLRWLVVTPDMHRVHHSIVKNETNSNFGFNLPWWDHLFGTYRDQPTAGHAEMVIGLEQFRDSRHLTLPWMLIQPFVADSGRYAINKRGEKS
jgi:sterol desaturase/sphingolipid hydroxylase (fatty acid hydroxylase superfamily)